MRKICLLGGSNSVMRNSFSSGLCLSGDVNLALGASSSLQNIHSLVCYRELVEKCDVIVTESNVNDIYNIYEVGYSKELVISNIRSLYDELARTGKFVISLLIPIKQYHSTTAPMTLVDEINELHRSLCFKYGIALIDVDKHFTDLNPDSLVTRYIQPDPLHPIDSFMYHLGGNIRKYIQSDSVCIESTGWLEESNFFNYECFEKENVRENSLFKRSFLRLKNKLEISVSDGFLVGIETWSSNPAQLVFSRKGKKDVIKSFNSLLAFNEIQASDLQCFAVESKFGVRSVSTEPSINVDEESTNEPVNISSMLFKKTKIFPLVVSCNGNKNLSFLIPSIDPYISGVSRLIEKLGLIERNEDEVDFLRNMAVLIEGKDLTVSYKLMSRAFKLRPGGSFIKEKVEEYKKLLQISDN
jgi:hypothetical protein